MAKTRKSSRLRPRAKSLPECLREFLTPAVFKQVRKAVRRRKKPRWDIHPLLLVVLAMTWCCGDSLPEKFEVARAFYVVCHPKRRRPGETFQGFQQALEKLPMLVLRTLASGIRARIEQLLEARWGVGDFIAVGCDGSRIECPRTEELEQRLGRSGKDDSAPMIWVTALVHLANGVPWAWRWGRGGKASERAHLCRMLKLLPKMALVVADAGYYGYELLRALVRAKVFFLLRMSSNVKLYTEERIELDEFREGIVYYWPEAVQEKGGEPIRARLIRVCSKKKESDVWLLTNVMEKKRLSRSMAAKLYRWRWENEGYFRTYKRTLSKVKLMSRTVRSVHREAEASMISTQLLLAQGALAMLEVASDEEPAVCSPRKVLLEIRRALRSGVPTNRRKSFWERIGESRRERRRRTTPKQKRRWPRRKDHKPPGPPVLLKLSKAQKRRLSQCQTAV